MGEEILFEENKHQLNTLFCNVPEHDRMLKNDHDEKSFTKVHQQNYQKILKIELTDDQQIQQVKKIADTLISISQTNPNIVKIIGADINEQEPKIQYEWCDENLQLQLYQKNKNNNHFSPTYALKIIKQILNGYKSLYFNKIIHKKIKPSNILFKGGTYKLADVSLGQEPNLKYQFDFYPLNYASPEILQNQTLTNATDMYSLGIIFYELLFGWTPYKVQSFSDALKITSKLIKYPIKCDLEGHVFKESQLLVEIKVLVESMVLFNQEERITWKDLLNHPLIKNKYVNDKILFNSTFYQVEDLDTSFEILNDFNTQDSSTEFEQEQDQVQIYDEKENKFFNEVEYLRKQDVQFSDIHKNPTQSIQKLVGFYDLSEQFQNFAIFHQSIYCLLEQQNDIENTLQIMLCLHYLVCCFFKISEAKKLPNEGITNLSFQNNLLLLNNKRQELMKRVQNKDEFSSLIGQGFQIFQIKLLQSYLKIRTHLKQVTQQEQVCKKTIMQVSFLFRLHFILEKMYERRGVIKNSINLCFFIQDIQNDISQLETMKSYLKKRALIDQY